MLKRIKKAYPDAQMDDPGRGITLDDYLTFHHFLQNINDVDIALTFYNIAGASIDEGNSSVVSVKITLTNFYINFL